MLSGNSMKKVTLYSDGACEGNPGPGGWAVVLAWENHQQELSGGTPATTNNRMELQAAVEGLRALSDACEVEFFTDSLYVRNGITEWLKNWKALGWKTKAKQPVKNQDLWKELDAESARHRITWKWLKGHAGHAFNERCDLLARTEVVKVRQQFTPNRLKTLRQEFQSRVTPIDPNGTLPGIL